MSCIYGIEQLCSECRMCQGKEEQQSTETVKEIKDDLISRSAVMELIESKFVDGCLEQGDESLIGGYGLLDEVSDLPVAFDLNKIAEQVGEEFERIAGELLDKTGSELQLCDFNIKPFTQRLAEIVKAGGVNEEV